MSFHNGKILDGESLSPKDNSYFSELGDNLASLMVSDVLTPASLNKLNNRQIYKSFSDFDIPKIVREAPSNADYDLAWKRLHSAYVRMDSRDIMYMLLHNKVPTPERLFRIGMKNDPYCLHCQQALVCDIEHLLCCCVRTEAAWELIRGLLIKMRGSRGMNLANFELLNLLFPVDEFEWEMVWLLTNFIRFSWDILNAGGSMVKSERLFEDLCNKFMEDKFKLVIPGLCRIFN